MGQGEAAEVLTLVGREVSITHPGKLFFSQQAILSKLDLVRYYLAVADGALRGIRDRPVVLKRYVDGAHHQSFYQKRAPSPRRQPHLPSLAPIFLTATACARAATTASSAQSEARSAKARAAGNGPAGHRIDCLAVGRTAAAPLANLIP